MSDVETILVVLGAFYVVEGASLPTRAARTFASAWGRWFKPRPADGLWGNEARSVHVGPIAPTGAMLVAEHWPISVGPKGVVAFNVSAPGLRFRPASSERFVTLTERTLFESEGVKLYADNRLVARTTRPESASWFAGILNQAAKLPVEARAEALEQRIASAYLLSACRERWEQVRKAAYWPRIAGTFGFLWIFGVGTACYYLLRNRPEYSNLLFAYWSIAVVWWCWAIAEFYIAHQKLYPARKFERFKMTVEALLPPSAMRAYHRLALPSLAAWHPLTVAAVVCNRSDFERFAREHFRDLERPLAPFGEDWPDEARRTELWHRERATRSAKALLEEMQIDLGELLKPPLKEDPSAAAWCPRCEREFGPGVEQCQDCGVVLERF
jgi:hypothetical protein